HQSSLGSLMLLAGPRLHALWLTPLLPMLFLISCFAMGFAGVIVESSLSGWLFRRPGETRLLRGLATPAAFSLLLYAVIRIADIVYRGKAGLLFTSGGYSVLFFIEMLLLVTPAFVLLAKRHVI